METAKQHVPVIVRAGVLTQREYDGLNESDRQIVDRETARLATKYGEGWLSQESDRLRNELAFMYGI